MRLTLLACYLAAHFVAGNVLTLLVALIFTRLTLFGDALGALGLAVSYVAVVLFLAQNVFAFRRANYEAR